MKRISQGGGVYIDERGVFWARPWVAGNRTWRKLKATRVREAQREANSTEFTRSQKFTDLATAYQEADCPNRRLESRDETFTGDEKKRLAILTRYFGRMDADEIRISHLHGYKDWRLKQLTKTVPGLRTVDKDLNTLSNVLNYGVAKNVIEFNFIRAGRPQFQHSSAVRHCRDVAPNTGDEVHTIARYFFATKQSEVLGWQSLFQAMTGCRTSELMRLRLDSKTPDEPGYIEGCYLFICRSKGGVNPWVQITPELKKMIAAFKAWHKERYSESPWFFPGKDKEHVGDTALARAMPRAVIRLRLHKITPHGFRSFYVTKRRSDGATDAQIASEIGDADVNQISNTYGSCPPNWRGRKKLSFVPEKGEPAWAYSFHEREPIQSPPVVHLTISKARQAGLNRTSEKCFTSENVVSLQNSNCVKVPVCIS